MVILPTHAVIGSTQPEAIAVIYGALGFEERRRGVIEAGAARALYGLDAAVGEIVMTVPGSDRGWLRIVETPHGGPHPGPYDRGPHAIDLYSRGIEASIGAAARAGSPAGPLVDYRIGPFTVREVKTVGPDHVVTVFIEVDARRPSVLDRDPARVNSEVHGIVWIVERVDDAVAFWRDKAGLGVLLDATTREPAVATFMGLPRADAAVRLAVLAEPGVQPPRVEFVEFPEESGGSFATWPLRGGLHALGCEVTDLEAAVRQLDGARFGPMTGAACGADGRRARVVAGLAPGGVRFELWESA